MIDRRTFLLGSLAIPVFRSKATPLPETSGIRTCGVNYDVGWGGTRPRSQRKYFRQEMIAIRDQLHTNHISILGSDPELLVEAVDLAADLGMTIKVQTRLNELPERDMQEHLTHVAVAAERVQTAGVDITLDVGCEYLLFVPGIVPGDDALERIDRVMGVGIDWDSALRKLNGLLHGLADTARSQFSGPLTYSDAPDGGIDWSPFDIIGLDHYRDASNQDQYVEAIRDVAALGKPVWINEFGACPYRGAFDRGGMAWDIFDWETDPPTVKPGLIRDEDEQADVIMTTLDQIVTSPAERTYVYQFIEPGSYRSADPSTDFDLGGYGLVTCWGDDHDRPYAATGYWEPKVVFNQLAAWNQRQDHVTATPQSS